MDEQTTGVILRVHPLTESSLIVRWLTEHFGRMATVAKGALRSKSSFRGKLDLLYQANFVFRRSRRSDLHTLIEVELCDSNPPFRQRWELLERAIHGVRLIERATEPETPLPEFYQLFCSYLASLVDCGDRSAWCWPAFQSRSLKLLGLSRPTEITPLRPEARALLQGLQESDWAVLPSLTSSREDATAVLGFLDQIIEEQFGSLTAPKRPGAREPSAKIVEQSDKREPN